ncbi:MAG TPA: rRNA adenine dimethyltransferase family protein [Candidatus Absconditabacterales bacterium]|nr:rRNA adenine dimethyltransferase family protein [Candidatus Absconditabacterales bacterium]
MGTYLGQNFLIDTKIRSYIADKISALYKELGCEALIEIGPGKGSITKLIQTISPHFFMIDKDPTFRDNGQLNIEYGEFILSDVLDLDVEMMLKEKKLNPEKTLVVGNLPYYITSPILRKFFGGKNFVGGLFMVQDEVGQKIKSDAKKKSYLRWLLNYGCTVTYLKGVPAKCFKPAPKVKSCLIELRIKDEELKINWEKFIEFLELFAPFSRKTLGAIQKMIQKKSEISFKIPSALLSKRLESLSWDELTVILAHKA